MPRRRVYVFDLAAILGEVPSPPPKRLRHSLAVAALTGVLIALGVVVVRLAVEAVPSHKIEAAVTFLVAYLAIVLVFVAVAMRVHRQRL